MESGKPDIVDRVIEFISFRFDQEVDRWQVIAGLCLAVLVLFYSGYNIARAWSARGVRVVAAKANEIVARADGTSGADSAATAYRFIYICGSVQKPGVYRVGAGTRLNAAIALAGGLTADADGNSINMARQCVDGERIYIPKIGEKLASDSGEASGPGGISSGADNGAGRSGQAGDGRININIANAAALDTIPGIGPTLAARIIDYRQKRNGFTDVDQLGEVEGIGPKTLAKIKPHISVE